MNEFNIKLDSVEKVKEFVKITNKIPSDMDLIVGRYIIDAKSIMGIFSIDLTRTLCLKIHSDNADECEEIKDISRNQADLSGTYMDQVHH